MKIHRIDLKNFFFIDGKLLSEDHVSVQGLMPIWRCQKVPFSPSNSCVCITWGYYWWITFRWWTWTSIRELRVGQINPSIGFHLALKLSLDVSRKAMEVWSSARNSTALEKSSVFYILAVLPLYGFPRIKSDNMGW